jgi:MFS family permease
MTEARVLPAIGTAEPWPSPARAWYAVAIFGCTVFTLFGNGFVVALMLEPIKHDLNFSDQQVALIFGLAGQFTLAFASLAISPLADRYSRTLIIGLGLLVLGFCNVGSAVVATAGALLTVRLIGGRGWRRQRSGHLLAARGPVPATQTTLRHGHDEHRLHGGGGLSYLVGGYLLRALVTPEYTLPVFGTLRSWQVVFLLMAIPDLLLGVLVLFTVHEARRRGRAPVAAATPPQGVSYAHVFRYLWDNRRAFGPMYIGLGINLHRAGRQFVLDGAFLPAHARLGAPGDFGVYQGWALLVLAPAGLLFGGWLAGRLARRGVMDANQRVVMWASLAHVPFGVSFALVPNPWLALALATLNTCVIGIGTGPQNAAFQSIVPNAMRAKITATFLFMFTMGSALGPNVVSTITENVFHDPNKLRYSLALVHGVLGPLAAFVFWKGLRAYGEAYARAQGATAAAAA